MIVLNQPIFHSVKKGDTLSEISWKLTGRKASVRDLKNWNTIWDDNIRPRQVLYLADPYDSFVKEITSRLSKYEFTGRNPKVSLDRLSDEMVAQHGGLFGEKHRVEIQLEFRERPEEIMSSEFFEKDPVQDITWAPGFSGGNAMGNNFDQPHYPDEVRLSGVDFMGSGENYISTTDIALAGVGTSAMVGEILTKRIMRSRSGFTSGKILPDSPRSYSKATATRINFTTKGIGWGLTIWSIYNTRQQFKDGDINGYRRNFNYLNSGVGVLFPISAIPIAVGDYYGQKHADEIVNDVARPGGNLYEGMKFLLELVGIPTEPDQ